MTEGEPEGQSTFLTFFVLTPQALPWPEGAGLTVVGAAEEEVPPYALRAIEPVIGGPGRWWVQLVFHQRAAVGRQDDQAFDVLHAVLQESIGLERTTRPPETVLFGPDDHRETVVEITTPLPIDDEQHVSEAIARGLDALRDADRATIVASDAARTPLAPADVWPLLPCVRRDATTGGLLELPRMVVLENNELRDRPVPDELGEEDMGRVEMALGAIQARHPFVRWTEWLLAAQEAQSATRPEDAVLRLAIAIEVMLDAVFALALWEKGDSPEDAAAPLSLDLAARIKRHFATLLGGSWDRTRAPVAPWSRDLAYLRGRVVHRGHRPSTEEVIAAFEAADLLYGHVVTQVVSRRHMLPKTALLLVGRRGLEQHDAWDGAVRRLGVDGGLHEDDWLLAYDRWRARVDTIITS